MIKLIKSKAFTLIIILIITILLSFIVIFFVHNNKIFEINKAIPSDKSKDKPKQIIAREIEYNNKSNDKILQKDVIKETVKVNPTDKNREEVKPVTKPTVKTTPKQETKPTVKTENKPTPKPTPKPSTQDTSNVYAMKKGNQGFYTMKKKPGETNDQAFQRLLESFKKQNAIQNYSYEDGILCAFQSNKWVYGISGKCFEFDGDFDWGDCKEGRWRID